MSRATWLVVVALLLSALGGVAEAGRVRRPPASPLVLPPRPRSIRIHHELPAHAELRCVACHTNAGTSQRAADDLRPPEATCIPCHAEAVARDAPGTARCTLCHANGARGADVELSAVVPARIHFSHAQHVAMGARCLDCHAGVASEGDVGRHMPTMRTCFTCHGESLGLTPASPHSDGASGECTTCHVALPDGRVRSRFPEGNMNPPSWLFGMRHDRDFLVRHRWIASDQGDACASCHAESECADCHDGRVRPNRVHPNDYLTVHPQMARREDPRCTSCHNAQTFCGECHARLGIAQESALIVRAAERFHPPPSEWTRGPVLHAREARRSMSACVSCHAENDCVQCHGSLGIGAGLSPHPDDFRSRCGDLLESNDRACRTCHSDVRALADMCD